MTDGPALAAALNALDDLANVTAVATENDDTGQVVYTIDFPASAGNVAELQATSLLTGAADDGHLLPGLQPEADLLQGLDTGIGVSEVDLIKFDLALYWLGGLPGVGDGRLGIQEFVDALLRGGSLLHDRGDPADGRYRPGEHIYI